MSMCFYVNSNAQPNGDHEVHRSDCSWLPSAENRVYLGCFSTSREAVNAARKYYRQVDGCCFCCPESHLLTAGMARPVYGRAIFCEEGNVKL